MVFRGAAVIVECHGAMMVPPACVFKRACAHAPARSAKSL